MQKTISKAITRAIPKGGLSVSEWAATYRYLSPMRSSRAGRWTNELTPYLVDVMDAFNNPEVKRIVFMASSQIGKTEVLSNIIGFVMHVDPGPMLFLAETEDKGRSWAKESLYPMIESTPVLKTLVTVDQKQEDSTLGFLKFPGGYLALAYATSAATLSSRPIRYLLCDEVDAYKGTKEGNPLELAEARTRTMHGAKIVLVSSPRDEATSIIEPEYKASYAGKYFVPCPHCGEYQTLNWRDPETKAYRLIFDPQKPREAVYACTNGCEIQHIYKSDMLAAGEWRFSGDFSGSVGFFLHELFSPFPNSTWGDVAASFVKKKGNLDSLKTFVNTSLAETWKEIEEEIHVGDLPERCETYDAEVPTGALILTAGVDVQSSPARLEYEIVGWGLDDESWSITRGIIFGDPTQTDVWEGLKAALARPYFNASGKEYRVLCAGIDSGGHYTNEVYAFCRRNKGRRWFAVKGANTPGKPLITKPTQQGKPPIALFTLGTEAAKDTFSAQLKITEPGPGYCHFPDTISDDGEPLYSERYFKQLVAEKPIEKYVRGVKQRVWVLIKQKERNEALDCRVYAMAAKAILNANLHKIAENQRVVEKSTPEVEAELSENKPKKAAKKPFLGLNKQKKSFVNGWR